MLRNAHDLQNHAIRATDGDNGRVKDFYFDDERWAVRYLLVETGNWLSGRKVLIPPMSTGRPNWTEKVLPVSITKEQVKNGPNIDTEKPHLRSANAVMRYHVEATDGDIGHVHSLLVDDETWAIRYIVVDTSNWWLGHQALVAPQWINAVRWSDARVSIDLTRQAVKDAPPYDSAARLNREPETIMYKHYERPGYWAEEAKHGPASRL